MYLPLVTGLENAVCSWMRFPLHYPGRASLSLVASRLHVHDIAITRSQGPICRASALKAHLKEFVLVVPLISEIQLFVDSSFWILVLIILLTSGKNV